MENDQFEAMQSSLFGTELVPLQIQPHISFCKEMSFWGAKGKYEYHSGAALLDPVSYNSPRKTGQMMSWQLLIVWQTVSAAQHEALWSPCQGDWQLNGTNERWTVFPLGMLPSLMDRKQRERLSLNLKRILFFLPKAPAPALCSSFFIPPFLKVFCSTAVTELNGTEWLFPFTICQSKAQLQSC